MSLIAFAGILLAAAPLPGPAASPGPAAAAPVQAASAPAPSSIAGGGVVRYNADFFVSMRPNTAFDMIQRLPGFAFDAGANVRGFAGAAGNVLIDGDRPTSKEDNLENILKRVSATQVDHIDLIRGAAPGIDMQGRTVLANVVLKSGSGVHAVVAVASNVYADGRLGPAVRLEASRQKNGKTLEFSLLPAMYVDDGAGNGPRVRTDPSGAVLVQSNLRADAGGKNVTATSAYTTPAWGGKFKVNVLGVYDRYHDDEYDHLVAPVSQETLHDVQAQGRGELGVHYEKALGPRLNLEALAIQQVKKKTYTSHFDTGAQVRGFSGAAGNVLIDGDRPTSKDDDLGAILQRIAAAQVDHIDLIRGGAPGIDMHGRTVLANVVRKSSSGLSGVAAVAGNLFTDGRVTPALRLEFTSKQDGRTLEGGILANMFVDDGTGDGERVRTDPDGNVLVHSQLRARAGGFALNATSAYETPLWGGKFRINAVAHMQNYKDNEDDHLTTPVGLELLRFRQDVANGELGVHFETALTPKLQLETLAIQRVRAQHVPSHFLSGSEEDLFAETDTSGESIARALLRYTQGPTLSVEGALEGDFNIQGSESTLAVDNAPVVLPAAHVTVSEKRGEASATATWKPDKRVTVEAGLRLEASQIASAGDVDLTHTLVFPKPRLLVTLSPDADDQLRLHLEREVGQLDFSSFVASSNLGTTSGSGSVLAASTSQSC